MMDRINSPYSNLSADPRKASFKGQTNKSAYAMNTKNNTADGHTSRNTYIFNNDVNKLEEKKDEQIGFAQNAEDPYYQNGSLEMQDFETSNI